MKLSEVIKAIEDGSNSIYQNVINGSKIKNVEGTVVLEKSEYGILTNAWQEVKPPRQWSEKELALFKLLPEWANWVAKDRNGDIVYSQDKLELMTQEYPKCEEWVSEGDGNVGVTSGMFDFLTITFEESPVDIRGLR